MKLIKRLFCIMTALLLVCAAALPAFAGRENNTPRTNGVTGDVNQNGIIDASDALLILRYALGIIDLEPELAALSDADGNGTVDTADALLVLRAALLPPAEEDFFMELALGETAYADIDGDGAADEVLIEHLGENEEMEWEQCTRLTITLAADPQDPFVHDVPNRWVWDAAIADCGLENGGLAVILGLESDERFCTVAAGIFDEGAGLEAVATEDFLFKIPNDFVYDRSEGVPMERPTEIFGSYYLDGRFLLTGNGFENITERYSYPTRWPWPLTLKRPMDVVLEDGSAYTVPTGGIIIARFTDMETYAIVELEDGRLGRVEVSFNNHHHPLINGIDQDEYAVMPYAD